LTKDALGDVDGAIESMGNALVNERTNLNYIFNLARLYQERNVEDDSKTAEALYEYILTVNDKEINTHFSLGMLYEKMNKKDEAIKKYRDVLALLPDGSDQAEKQIQRMISNIQNGIENTQENLTDVPEIAPESTQTSAVETPGVVEPIVDEPIPGSENNQ